MVSETDLNIIVSNVVAENRHSHCRLCLKDLKNDFLLFEDFICTGNNETDFQTVSYLLKSILGSEICDDIPGLDAVCKDCIDETIAISKFLKKCESSTKTLEKIFDNLYTTLNLDIEIVENHNMYVMVNENDCKIMFVNEKESLNNITNKKQTRIICNECDITFENNGELIDHNIETHANVTCVQCHEKFPTAKALKSHTKSIHNNDNMFYICEDCGKLCKGLKKLQSHEKKHFTKSNCPKCDKAYLTRDSYKKHVELCVMNKIELHPFRSKSEKNHCCTICGKGYSTPGGLRVHHKFEHGGGTPHVCEMCGKKFTAPSYLKIHMVTHTKERKFSCDTCHNHFVSKEALLYHIRRKHTGEKPYSCKLCPEKFVNSSARAEHIKYKHNDPTFTCDICYKKFYTQNFLKQHKSRHHDPTSKLYAARNVIPPNVPGEENKRGLLNKLS